MYYNEFIEDFSLTNYYSVLPKFKSQGTDQLKTEILIKETRLREIADAYIHQYDRPTYLETLAFKESLDHYVLKELKTNPNFKKSVAFTSYCRYLRYIMINRRSEGNCCLECNTNVVLNDPDAKRIVLSQFNTAFQAETERVIKSNNELINQIYLKIKANEHLSQQEINYLGDYLYTKRDTDSDLHEEYIKYLINEMKNNPQIKSSPQIVSAYMSYLPKFFNSGCENKRIFFTNGLSNKTGKFVISELEAIRATETDKNLPEDKKEIWKNPAYSSGKLKCISIGNELCDLDLRSDKSLSKSRGYQQKDLYWISMVCFHELTHQYQKSQVKNPIFNSSGFSQIIRNFTNKKDYKDNHDNYEMEIEADETSWKKMGRFVGKFQKDKSKKDEQLKHCITNEKAVYGRRTFITKKDFDDDWYFKHDIDIIKQMLKEPKALAKFREVRQETPMMQMAFTEDGKLKSELLFKETIASKGNSGTDPNIMGSEVAKYILTEQYSDVKEYIRTTPLTEQDALRLLQNIYGAYHTDKTYIRELYLLEEKVKKEKQTANNSQQSKQQDSLSKQDTSIQTTDLYGGQYDETTYHFDLTNIREKYLQKFKNIADIVYRERELENLIQSKYPTYSLENYTGNGKYAMWNYQDAFDFLYNHSKGVVSVSEVADVVAKYESSKDPILMKLASQTKTVVISSGQATQQIQTYK